MCDFAVCTGSSMATSAERLLEKSAVSSKPRPLMRSGAKIGSQGVLSDPFARSSAPRIMPYGNTKASMGQLPRSNGSVNAKWFRGPLLHAAAGSNLPIAELTLRRAIWKFPAVNPERREVKRPHRMDRFTSSRTGLKREQCDLRSSATRTIGLVYDLDQNLNAGIRGLPQTDAR
jgi:hypothetical protein